MGEERVTMILASDPNIAYSPYNWAVGTTAKTVNAGAYFKLAFSGTPTTLTAGFDVTSMASPPSRVGFRVDGGPWQDFDIAATLTLAIPSDRTWDTHVVEMVVIATTETSSRWSSPQSTAVIFTGITGNATITATTVRRRALYGLAVGDSIAEGVRTLNKSAAADTNRNDSRLAWAHPLGDLLGAEIGVVGFGSQGISKGGNGGVPKFADAAPYLFDKVSRDLKTPKAPDFIVAHIGTNDSGSADAAVVADTTALLNYWISSTPDSTRIFVAAGWLQRKAEQIQAGIAACNAPARVTYVDTSGWWSTADASDALHPYGYANLADLAPRLAATIRPAVTATLPAASLPVKVFYRGPGGDALPLSAAAF